MDEVAGKARSLGSRRHCRARPVTNMSIIIPRCRNFLSAKLGLACNRLARKRYNGIGRGRDAAIGRADTAGIHARLARAAGRDVWGRAGDRGPADLHSRPVRDRTAKGHRTQSRCLWRRAPGSQPGTGCCYAPGRPSGRPVRPPQHSGCGLARPRGRFHRSVARSVGHDLRGGADRYRPLRQPVRAGGSYASGHGRVRPAAGARARDNPGGDRPCRRPGATAGRDTDRQRRVAQWVCIARGPGDCGPRAGPPWLAGKAA